MTGRSRSAWELLGRFALAVLCVLGVFLSLTTHPQPGVQVAAVNGFLTLSMVAYEQMRVLFNELVLVRHGMNRQYNHLFAAEGAKAGAVVNARKPPQYTIRIGQAISPQAMVETPAPIAIQPQFGIDLEAAGADFSLSIDDFSARFIRPAAVRMSSYLDVTNYTQLYPQVWNAVGTPGTPPTTIDTYLNAQQLLDESDAPDDDERLTIMNPLMERKLVNGVTAILNPQKQLGEQWIKGRAGRLANFEVYMSQSVPNQTTGVMAAGASAVKVNGLNQIGSSLITNGWTAGDIMNAGDVIQSSNTHSVNPQNKTATQSLLNMVCTTMQTADGSGNMTIPIATQGNTGIVTSGQFQNADNAPTTNDVISVYGNVTPSAVSGKVSPVGMALHPDWAAFVMVDLPAYDKGIVECFRVPAPELGLSLRVIKGYLLNSDQLVTRLDGLFGNGLLYGELASRIQA